MDLSKELVRLATYVLWPNDAKISPLSLARAGFFYVGNEDEVECFQCKIRLKGWTEEHDPVTRHRQEAPHCPLWSGHSVVPQPLETNRLHANGASSLLGAAAADQVIGLFAKETYGTACRQGDIRTQTGAISHERLHRVIAVIDNRYSIEVEDASDIQWPPDPRVHSEEAAPVASTGDAALSLGAASADQVDDNSIPSGDSTPSENSRKKKRKKKRR